MMQDLWFALRMARKQPGITLAIFLALALGIGGATAVFSVVNAAMLRPLPVRDGWQLVRVYATEPGSDEGDISMADYLDWKRDLSSFSDSAAFLTSQVTLTGLAVPQRAVCFYAEWTLLRVLGIAPLAGRYFAPIDNQRGHTDEVILGWQFWRSHFGGQNVIGKRILLDEQPFTIVGILPAKFAILGNRDLLLPLTLDPKSPQNRRGYHRYQVIARLAPGVSLKAAKAELASYAAKAAHLFPVENKGVGARIVSLAESLSGEGLGAAQKHVRAALLILLLAILCVLAIACGNVASINLMRALVREPEIAVRAAMGASRWQLFRQVLVESLLISLAASIAGLAIAAVLVRLLTRLSLNAVPRIEETSIDWRVFLFALGVGCLTGIGFGLAPAVRSGRVSTIGVLRQGGGRSIGSRRQGQLRQVFVAAEAALATLLLIECGLFIKSFLQASAINPGFSIDHVLTFYLALPSSHYGNHHLDAAAPLFHNVLAQLDQVPGVVSTALAIDLPLTGTAADNGILVQGRSRSAHIWDVPSAVTTEISPGYFKTFKIRLLGGKHQEEGTTRADEVVVNETFARRFFPGESAVGQRIAISVPQPDWKQIVGVVADVPPVALEQQTPPEVFFRLTKLITPWLGVVVRVRGDPLEYVDALRAAIAKVDPAIAIFLPRSAQQVISRQLLWRDFQTWLVSGFAVLAVALAALGTFAVIAYSTAQKINEIGVRMAIGAPAASISRMILWQGVRPALIGTAIGSAGGFATAHLTANLLFGTDAHDANVYTASTVILIFVSFAASAIPAWRAAAIEPWNALRHE